MVTHTVKVYILLHKFINPKLLVKLMLEKRKVGWKSKTSFDFIDMDIMSLLLREQPLAVLELGRKMNLPHNNLKRHLDKLLKSKLIKRVGVPKSRKILIYLGDVYSSEIVKGIVTILNSMKGKAKKNEICV